MRLSHILSDFLSHQNLCRGRALVNPGSGGGGAPGLLGCELPHLPSRSVLLSDDYVPSVSVFSTTGSLSTSATVSLFSLFISLEDVSFS